MDTNDFLKIEAIVNNALDEKLKPISEKISHLPTREQFYKRMDKLAGQLKKTDETQTLHQGQHDRHDEEHERLKKHLKLPLLA